MNTQEKSLMKIFKIRDDTFYKSFPSLNAHWTNKVELVNHGSTY